MKFVFIAILFVMNFYMESCRSPVLTGFLMLPSRSKRGRYMKFALQVFLLTLIVLVFLLSKEEWQIFLKILGVVYLTITWSILMNDLFANFKRKLISK